MVKSISIVSTFMDISPGGGMNKSKRQWSNADARSLLLGEFHNYFGGSYHTYQESEWYVWFLGNPTRYAMFFLFLEKYGKGEMVSYTDLTLTKKIGQVNLKIDSIKSTVRDALELDYIKAFKSDDDGRVTLYDLNTEIVQEIADYCFCMRRNRMMESAKYIHSDTTLKVSKELNNAITKDSMLDALSSIVEHTNKAVEAKIGKKKKLNLSSVSKKKSAK